MPPGGEKRREPPANRPGALWLPWHASWLPAKWPGSAPPTPRETRPMAETQMTPSEQEETYTQRLLKAKQKMKNKPES